MSLASLVTHQGKRVTEGPKARAQAESLAALEAHLQSPACASVFAAYRTVQGSSERPIVAVENQCDAQRSAYAEDLMTRLSKHMFVVIRAADGGAEPERACVHAAKKWLMAHNGTYPTREDRKAVSEGVARAVWRHYAAAPLTALCAEAAAARPALNRHDMADAFLLAMQEALNAYAAHTKTVLPRRRRGEQRSDTPVLDAAQLGGGGTIRVLGIDPGERAMGLCLLELCGMQAAPEAGGEPLPLFRVLLLQLVDLKSAYSAERGHAVLHYAAPPTPGPPYVPVYEPPDMRTVYARVDAEIAAIMAVRNARKRPRPAAHDGGDDDADSGPISKWPRDNDPQ